MIDFPAASPPPAPPADARRAASSPQRDAGAQPDPSAFQAMLAQELGAAPAAQAAASAPTAQTTESASAVQAAAFAPTARAAADDALPGRMIKAKPDFKIDEHAAAANATSAAPDAPPPVAVMPFLPLPSTASSASAASGAEGAKTAPLRKAGEHAARVAAASDAPGTPLPTAMLPLPSVPAGPSSSPPSTATPTAGRAALQLDSRLGAGAPRSAAANAKEAPQATAAAADLGAPGQSVPPANSELQRAGAFKLSLLEQHKDAAPAPLHAGAVSAAAATQASAPAALATLDARVGERGWDQSLGDKLVWMAGQKHQVAELHLNPPELGPLKITLTLNHDQASAQFVSAHAPVREAIETAMPRLREMLADSGITLGNTSVGTDAFREPAQPQAEARSYHAAAGASATDASGLAHTERLLRHSLGLVDTFA